MSSWDFLSKFVLVGDSSVGKSSLLVQLTEQRFLADPDPTVGVEFGSYIVTIQETGERVKCQCWDTAGSETFRSITRSYYRGAAGALLVYNVTHRPSFLHIGDWLRDVREHAEENVSIILVGNMADLCDKDEEEAENSESARADGEGAATPSPSKPRRKRRQVTRQEAEQYAEQEGIMFVETSAKTGLNVQEAFERAARDIHAKFKASIAANGDSTVSRSGLKAGKSRPGVVAASLGEEDAGTGRSCCVIV